MPALALDNGDILTQSLAIIEYLDEMHPKPPLLPADPVARAKVRAFAALIACDIHPLNNLIALQYLAPRAQARAAGDRRLVSPLDRCRASTALETMIKPGPYCFGGEVTLADVCLVPQVYNARRLKVPLDKFPKHRRGRRRLPEASGVRQGAAGKPARRGVTAARPRC